MKARLVTVAAAALAGAFISLVICISITPVREWTQELAVCRGADRVQRDVQDSGTVVMPTQPGRRGATTTFDLVCTYPDGRQTAIGNDRAVLGGIGVSLLLGMLAGGIPALAASLRRGSRRPPG